MIGLISKLIKTTDDKPKVISFLLLFLFSIMGIEFIRIARDSYFLSTVGAQYIPYMFTFMACSMLVASGIYSVVVDKFSRLKLLIIINVMGIILSSSLYVILEILKIEIEYLPFIVYCLVETYVMFNIIHLWNYINTVFDQWEGKTVFPLLGGAGLMGTFIGGGFISMIVHFSNANTLFICWSVLLILIIFIAIKCQNKVTVKKRGQATMMFIKKQDDDFEKATIKDIWKQPLIKTLTYMVFPMWIIINIIEYYYYDKMSVTFKGNDLAFFLGAFVSIASLTGLILQFSLTPWLLKKFGVGSTSMIYPFSLTIACSSLCIFSLFPGATGTDFTIWSFVILIPLSRFCDVAIYYSVYESSAELLYYGVPDNLRSKAKSFISGTVVPLATALSGVGLILLVKYEEPIYNVAFLGICLSFVLIVFGLNLTPDYLKSLLSNIKPSDHLRRQEVLNEIGKLDLSDTRYVMLDAITSDDHLEAEFAFKKLTEIKDDELVEDITEIMHRIQPEILTQLSEFFKINFPDNYEEFESKLNTTN
ncbi:MAG: hypothetical protein COA79_20085 [Planctomycetota bacterium]|nr:MAG: hypothetical protein COA79_20085 [Planctomycetota bacterium]